MDIQIRPLFGTFAIDSEPELVWPSGYAVIWKMGICIWIMNV